MPGPFGPGCFCCTSSLCRRALLPDRAGAFTSLSITNFIMIYCLTVSERASIVPLHIVYRFMAAFATSLQITFFPNKKVGQKRPQAFLTHK